MNPVHSLLRKRGQQDSSRVGMIELFFDLVFVFAVTQLSHTLLAHLTASGAVQTSMLLLAVWWVWIYTSWVTNWLDPERLPVRLCLFALMLAGLLVSVSIPEAFGERGLLFACAYVSMHVGRTLFVLWAVRGESLRMRRNFQRIFVWLAMSGTLWIVGGCVEGASRQAWWACALLLELIGPWVLYWVPLLGSPSTADWDIDGSHMAERCGLFVIIALGESLLVTGATFAETAWNTSSITAFLVAVLGTIAMSWLYFDTGAERAHHRIKTSSDPGRQGRLAYTYLHTLIVGGVIVCAVADELALAHPDHATNAGIAAILAGPAMYIAGNGLFKWVTNDRRTPPLSHMVGIVLLAILTPFALRQVFSALMLATATTAILILVAAWETVAIHRPAVARSFDTAA